MPSFNQVEYIERSILSIANQEYPDLQFIVVDGGSTDGTIQILNKYRDIIDVLISEKDSGQSDALNKGFSLADGAIFGWLNSDDIYLPKSFARAASAFVRHEDKDIVFGDWLSIDENDDLLDYNHAFDFSLNHFKYEGFHLNAQAMFWRRSVHDSFSGFDIDLFYTMDYQMIIDFGARLGDSVFLRIPVAFGAFRRYEGQKTSGFTEKVAKEHLRIAGKYGFLDKYRCIGYLKRACFRLRRGFWLIRRGGINNFYRRLRTYFKRRIK